MLQPKVELSVDETNTFGKCIARITFGKIGFHHAEPPVMRTRLRVDAVLRWVGPVGAVIVALQILVSLGCPAV
jgi:hypothetical protein